MKEITEAISECQNLYNGIPTKGRFGGNQCVVFLNDREIVTNIEDSDEIVFVSGFSNFYTGNLSSDRLWDGRKMYKDGYEGTIRILEKHNIQYANRFYESIGSGGGEISVKLFEQDNFGEYIKDKVAKFIKYHEYHVDDIDLDNIKVDEKQDSISIHVDSIRMKGNRNFSSYTDNLEERLVQFFGNKFSFSVNVIEKESIDNIRYFECCIEGIKGNIKFLNNVKIAKDENAVSINIKEKIAKLIENWNDDVIEVNVRDGFSVIQTNEYLDVKIEFIEVYGNCNHDLDMDIVGSLEVDVSKLFNDTYCIDVIFNHEDIDDETSNYSCSIKGKINE